MFKTNGTLIHADSADVFALSAKSALPPAPTGGARVCVQIRSGVNYDGNFKTLRFWTLVKTL